MQRSMYVEISSGKESRIKIICPIPLGGFCFPYLGHGEYYGHGYRWFSGGESTYDPGGGRDLFCITCDNEKLIFHSDWTHEFTSEGVRIDVLGSGNVYIVNFGFTND